jgi:hypothetical protein
MNARFRKRLFIFFVSVFCIGGILVVAYSQGFRVDIGGFAVVKVGGVYIDSTPRDVEVYLSGQVRQDSSGILRSGIFIANVLPKRYRLQLIKDGYHDYEKNIEVQPGTVVRLLNILLVPKTLTPSRVREDLSGDTFVAVSGTSILTQDSTKGTYYLESIEGVQALVNLTSRAATFFRQKIINVIPNPTQPKILIAQTKSGLYRIDIERNDAVSIAKSAVGDVFTKGSNLYFTAPSATSTSLTGTASATLEVFDLALNRLASSYNLPFEQNQIASLDALTESFFAILLDNGALWLYDASNQQMNQIAHSAQSVSFSPDKKKVLFQDKNGQVFIYFLADDGDVLDKGAGQTVRLGLVNAARITHIVWFKDSYHLLVHYPDKITFAEISSLEPINQPPLLEDDVSALRYDVDRDLLSTFKKEGVLAQFPLQFK